MSALTDRLASPQYQAALLGSALTILDANSGTGCIKPSTAA